MNGNEQNGKNAEKIWEENNEGKEKKTKKGKRKTGVQGGVPLCAADKNFPKERKKINGWKEQRKNNGPVQYAIGLLQNFFGTFSNKE